MLGLGWAFGEKKSEKNHVFHAKEHIYNMLISLSESPLLALSTTFLSAILLMLRFALSLTISTERNSSCTKRDNSRSMQFPLRLELPIVCFLH